MKRVGSFALRLAALPACFGIVLAAWGWLYLLRPAGGPGPRVADALPLDELPLHAAVSVTLFLATWGAAALLLALLARLAGLERLTAALLLALGVGLFGYLAAGVSLLVVRQVPAEDAFRAAGALRSVYAPALLAGACGALLGRGADRPRARAPLVLAWFVAAAGILAALDAILPEHSGTLLATVAPGARPLTHALEGPLGLALVYVAPGLARRRRRAWQAALALLGGSTLLHVLHSDYGAASTGLLAVALVARRHDFRVPGEPGTTRRLAARAVVLGGALYAYGICAVLANAHDVARPAGLGVAVRETTLSLLGGAAAGRGELTGDFGHWFGPSVLLLGLAGAGSLLHGWLAPWRYRLRQEQREREDARELVRAFGVDTLAPFVLRADKSYFFTPDRSAFVAYRVVGGVAIVSGDPIGPRDAFPALLAAFIEHARERGWRLAVLGASERCLPLYRACGLHALYHGDEALIEVGRFSLAGRPIRKVRQSSVRLARAGYTARVLHPREIDAGLRAELEEVARCWRAGAPERGFAMALDALFRLEDEDAVFVVGVGPDGRAGGFLHFAVCHGARTLSLSSMPRLRDTPNGFNEWLVCESVGWARANGVEWISLNFAPFAALLAPGTQLSGLQRLEARGLRALKGHFQLDNLLAFNRKFGPSWERRFVVYERRRDLPRIGVAALAAEAYLPFARRAGA